MTSMKKVFAAYDERCAVLAKSTHPFAAGVAWVAGKLVPLDEATIPLRDQGFLHSDLTYDVPAVWDGRFFRLNDHLDRLERSCHKIRLRLPLPKEEIARILVDMVVQSGIRDAFVELIVTRGTKGVRGSRGLELVPNLYLFVEPYIWVMSPDVQLSGGNAIVARTVRRIPPGSFDPTVKNLMWGDFTRGLYEAQDRNADYPFLTDGDANLTEGAGYNIVLIKDGTLFTPDRGVLEGVTRSSVFSVAKAKGIPVRLEVVPVELAYQADEIFMCTTAGGIMPITTLDGKPIKDGKIGPITTAIWDGYWELHHDAKYSFAIDYTMSSVRAKL